MTAMMAISRYEARPRSPKVQKTTAATCVSSAKYWMRAVAPVNSAESATPASTMLSGVISRKRESARMAMVEAMAPRKAHMTVR